jgi:hypothetical protein
VDTSTFKIELSLRAGMMAKSVLEMVGSSRELARLHLAEVAKQFREIDEFLKKGQ